MNIRRAKRSDTENHPPSPAAGGTDPPSGDALTCSAREQKKYSEEELLKIIEDDSRPVFVAEEPEGAVLGYAFCIFQQYYKQSADDRY